MSHRHAGRFLRIHASQERHSGSPPTRPRLPNFRAHQAKDCCRARPSCGGSSALGRWDHSVLAGVVADELARLFGGIEREASAIAETADELSVVHRLPTECGLGDLHVIAREERVDFRKQFVLGHAPQFDGQMPKCQWALSQVTAVDLVGNVPQMDSAWRQRLRDGIAAKGTTMKRLSKDAGLGETFVRDILERDRNPSIENARKLEEKLGFNEGSIFGSRRGEASVTLSRGDLIEVAGAEYARLPVHDIRFAAGAGAINDDETPIDHYLVSLSWLRSLTRAPLNQIRVFQADGDSMEPTIYNRDWVFVDTSRTRLTNPGIYALVFEGDGLLKRATQHLESGAVELSSDNPRYKPMTIKKPDRLMVVGRIFLSIRRH